MDQRCDSMSMRSTLPVLAVLVMVLLLDAPRSIAQTEFCPPPPSPSTQEPIPPPSPSSQQPPGPTVQQELQVWNASRYPATDFRSELTPPMFALWPENLSYVKFEYYCEDTSKHARRLEDFVYKEGQGILVTRPYFDAGLVDKHFTPYFQHWQFWQVDIKRITCKLDCEYSDLQRLYDYSETALVILQVAVSTALLRMCTLSTQQRIPDPSASIATPTFWSTICHALHTWKSETPWRDCISDWIHLLHLVNIGFAMMEGVGHSDYFRWRSKLLYNAGVAYTWLTHLCMISSFLHQCAHFLTRLSITVSALPSPMNAPILPKNGLSGDWRHQGIFGQFGVMVLMRMYLIGVDDGEGKEMDSVGGIVVAATVVACIWSAVVSAVVVVRSMRVIFRCLRPRAWNSKLPAFSGSKAHEQPASPQPASKVSTAKPIPRVSRSKTM